MVLLMSRWHSSDLDGRRLVQVASRFAALAQTGVAVEHFPCYVNTRYQPHRVDVVLFSCVRQGRGVHRMGEQAISVSAGDVGVTLYGQDHDLLTEGSGMDVVNVYLDLRRHPLPLLPAPWNAWLAGWLPLDRNLVPPRQSRLHIRVDPPDRLFALLDWMVREQAESDAGRPNLLAQLIVLLLVELARAAIGCGDPCPADRSPRAPAWLAEVRSFIDRHHDRDLTMEDLLRIACVRPEHLCRRFKQYTGVPPMTYLALRRVQAAAWLLRTTPWTVTTIAHRCGFGDLSHFNRTFRQRLGCSPTAYRRRRLHG